MCSPSGTSPGICPHRATPGGTHLTLQCEPGALLQDLSLPRTNFLSPSVQSSLNRGIAEEGLWNR